MEIELYKLLKNYSELIFFRLNLAILMGAITGSMTSTPALNIVTGASKSTIPALGFAGTYTFANVFLALAGALIMIIQ
jgi:putative transport protein